MLSSTKGLRVALFFSIGFVLFVSGCKSDAGVPTAEEYSVINAILAYFAGPTWAKANAASPDPGRCFVETNFLPVPKEIADSARHQLEKTNAPGDELKALENLLRKQPAEEDVKQLLLPPSCLSVHNFYGPDFVAQRKNTFVLLETSRVGFDPGEYYAMVFYHHWNSSHFGIGSGEESIVVLKRDGSEWHVVSPLATIVEN